MLMKDSKKDDIAMILAKKLGKPDELSMPAQSEDGTAMDQSIGYNTAAEELIAAVESKSASAVVDAIKSLVQMCMNEPEPEDSEAAPEQE